MIYGERTCLIRPGARYLDSAHGPPGWDGPGDHIGQIGLLFRCGRDNDPSVPAAGWTERSHFQLVIPGS